jgi:hypothetical protein
MMNISAPFFYSFS